MLDHFDIKSGGERRLEQTQETFHPMTHHLCVCMFDRRSGSLDNALKHFQEDVLGTTIMPDLPRLHPTTPEPGAPGSKGKIGRGILAAAVDDDNTHTYEIPCETKGSRGQALSLTAGS